MAKRSTSRLVNLSSETKTLVNRGVYSLYSLSASAALEGAKYILYTSKRSFLLSDVGAIVKEESPQFKIAVDQAIHHIDVDGTPITTLKKFA